MGLKHHAHCPIHRPHPHSNVCPNPLRPHRSQRFAHFSLSPPFHPPPLTAFTHSSAIVPTRPPLLHSVRVFKSFRIEVFRGFQCVPNPLRPHRRPTALTALTAPTAPTARSTSSTPTALSPATLYVVTTSPTWPPLLPLVRVFKSKRSI